MNESARLPQQNGTVEITIRLTQTGMQIGGPSELLSNTIMMFGIFEAAKDTIRQHSQQGAKSPIVVPQMVPPRIVKPS